MENAFKQLREALGLTQTEAGKALGCGQANISKIEKRGVRISELRRLAESKGVKLSFYVKLKNDKEPILLNL